MLARRFTLNLLAASALALGLCASAGPDFEFRADRLRQLVPEQFEKMKLFEPLKAGESFDVERHGIELIRNAYRNLEQYVEPSGAPIEFELSDFRVIPGAEFSNHRWLDFIEMPSGRMIDMTRSEFYDGPRDLELTHFIPEWVTRDAEWETTPWGLELKVATIQDALSTASSQEDRYQAVEAIIAYRVKVTFEGDFRVYGAAALFLPADADESTSVKLHDLIVQGVEEAVIELYPPGATRSRELGRSISEADGTRISRLFEETQTVCLMTNFQDDVYGGIVSDNLDHSSGGFHRGQARHARRCQCSANCISTCTNDAYKVLCEDSGNSISACHRMNYAVKGTQVESYNGLVEGAICESGFQCSYKACNYCLCNFSFSIGGGVGSISFGSTGGQWSMEKTNKKECAPCEPDPEYSRCVGCTEPDPGLPQPGNHTPILIDLAQRGFRFTAPEDGVYFDLDSNDAAERLSWTEAGSDDAWLALDRDGNGSIDDGTELFGDLTPQPPSDEPNGYRALAVFDGETEGGDGDGAITARDAVYSELRLWVDDDHDGLSRPEELFGLGELGIARISLEYKTAMRSDAHGNLFRFHSDAILDDGGRTRTVDVFLVADHD